MLGSSLFFSIISILFKYVTKSEENFWVSSFWEYSSWAIIGLVLFIFIKKYRVDFLKSLKHDGRVLFGVNIAGEAVNTIGNSLGNFVALLVPVVLVYSVEALQPIFIFIFGIAITLFFPKLSQEDISKKALFKKGIPILFMILGTFLILR
jgi:drug/metabolite transporter (DMT)-like permease